MILNIDQIRSRLTLLLILVITSLPASADFKKGEEEFRKKDFAAAFREWLPLAQQGDAQAANAVGALYDRGLGVDKDDRQAAKWYEQAAQAGFALAMRNLANLYVQGQGVAYDIQQARYWYGKAGALGDQVAVQRLAQLDRVSPTNPEPTETIPVGDGSQKRATEQATQPRPLPIKITPPTTKPGASQAPKSVNADAAPAVAAKPTIATSAANKTPDNKPAVSSTPGSTIEDLRAKPIAPASSNSAKALPPIKAAPVPKVTEVALPTPAVNPTPATPTASGSSIAASATSNAPLARASVENAENWLLGHWEGPSLGCPPNGGLEFTPGSVNTYFGGKIVVTLKVRYGIDGNKITVQTENQTGALHGYIYRRISDEKFVIDAIPEAMPKSLIGAEHTKCST